MRSLETMGFATANPTTACTPQIRTDNTAAQA